MKHYIDIENAKPTNLSTFEPGDIIQITEKVDGSNASIAWDESENCIMAYSRKQELSFSNTLRGFWNYVQTLQSNTDLAATLRDNQFVVFGEWDLNCNKIKSYKDEYTKTWIVYDIYNPAIQTYMPQDYVKAFCKMYNFEYIHELYYGAFTSWDDIKSYLNENTYGSTQEGVVVKNQSKLNNRNMRQPFYLKIVNASFAESIQKVRRPKSPEELEQARILEETVASIVTRRRVEKGIEKLRDEGVFPIELTEKDLGLVAKNLPKYIYEDCVKEEKETVVMCGDRFNKLCSSLTMKLARDIIIRG